MSPPVTDLEERRKQREAREAAAPAERNAAQGQTARAARDLLNGLIAGGEQPQEERGSDLESETTLVNKGARQRDPETSYGEAVHELVRRVQQHTAASMRDASADAPRRAPSTADLPPDAAVPRRRIRQARNDVSDEPASSPARSSRTIHRWVVGATTAAAGIALLLVAAVTTLGGGDATHRLRASNLERPAQG
jgi:hypothetical protein